MVGDYDQQCIQGNRFVFVILCHCDQEIQKDWEFLRRNFKEEILPECNKLQFILRRENLHWISLLFLWANLKKKTSPHVKVLMLI